MKRPRALINRCRPATAARKWRDPVDCPPAALSPDASLRGMRLRAPPEHKPLHLHNLTWLAHSPVPPPLHRKNAHTMTPAARQFHAQWPAPARSSFAVAHSLFRDNSATPAQSAGTAPGRFRHGCFAAKSPPASATVGKPPRCSHSR